ncbi:kinase-like domain-containing protein [Tribonema minus]|uniref:Kinase-like domain-containing protein n=1 Tax=Tribonema minus TaxID=303371 RepID=A0A836CNJ0_9STRA|nr:kinase-like domain-containing protein [Tribonema minus]
MPPPSLAIVVPREPTGTPCGRISFKRRLGAGAEGGVWLGQSTISPHQLSAVKTIEGRWAYDRYRALRASLQALKHPHIVSIRRLQWEAAAGRAYIVMELVDLDMQQFVVQSPGQRLDEGQASRFTRQALSALHHCHKQQFAHGDVKLENLLYKRNTNSVKLCDFGGCSGATWGSSPLSGSASYMPPELHGNAGADAVDPIAADMWSLGVTVFAMCAGHVPWSHASGADRGFARFRDAAGSRAAMYPAHFSPALRDFLGHLLAVEPERRYSAAQAAQHAWLATAASAWGGARSSIGGAGDEAAAAEAPPAAPAAAAPWVCLDEAFEAPRGRRSGSNSSCLSPVAPGAKRARSSAAA